MRTEAHELQRFRVRLAVNEDQVRTEMAIAVILPVAGQGMVPEPGIQFVIFRQDLEQFRQSV